MPLFAQLFAFVSSTFAAFFTALLAARVSVRVLAVAVIGTALAGFLVAFNEFVAPLAANVFASEYGQLLGLAFPPLSGTVLTGLLALWTAGLVLRLTRQTATVVASI